MKKLLFIAAILLSTAVASAQSALGVTLNAKDSMGNWATYDGTVVYFGDFSDSVTLDDAIKLVNPLENIAIGRNVSILGVEKRRTHVTTTLLLWKLRKGVEYELVLNKLNVTVPAAVEDLKTGAVTMFADTLTRYRFTTDTSIVKTRFKITFPCVLAIDTTKPVVPTREKVTFAVYPNPSTNCLYVKGLPAGRHDVIFNGPERKVYSIVSDGRSPISFNHNLRSGVYYISIDGCVTKIVIISK